MDSVVYVRDDDVLLPSSSYENELGRLKQIHEWVVSCPEHFHHVVGILCKEIQEFPEAIEWVRSEWKDNRLTPELHGWEHIDYAALPREQVKEHLNRGIEWMDNNLDRIPVKWYTPWGAGADDRGAFLQEVATEVGLSWVGVGGCLKLRGRESLLNKLKGGRDISYYYGQEILIHWWEGGARLKRVVEVAKKGSWEAAVAADPGLFK